MKLFHSACLAAALMLVLSTFGCSDADDKKDAENKKKTERQLAQIPGFQNATVKVRGDTVTVSGLKIDFGGVWPGAGKMSVEEISAEGVDFDADTKPGVVPIAKKIVYKGYRSEEGVPDTGLGGGVAFSEVERMEILGMRMDVGALQKVLDAKPASPAELYAPYRTGAADALSLKNYRLSFNMGGVSGSASIDTLSCGVFNMAGWEDLLMENITCSAMGVDVYSVDKWAIKQASVPDILTPYLNALTAQGSYERELAAALKKNPLVLRGMVMEGIKLRPMTTDSATVKKLALDLEVSPDKLIVKSDVEGVVVPPSVSGMIMGMNMASLYDKTFEFSGKVDFESAKKEAGGRMDLNALNVNEKNLGGAGFSFAGSFPKGQEGFPAFPEGGELYLTSLALNFKDTGALDLYFAMMEAKLKSFGPDVMTKDMMREQAVREAAEQGMEGGARRKVAEALAKFFGGSGSFSLSLAPKEPVLIYLVGQALELVPAEDLNLKVSAE